MIIDGHAHACGDYLTPDGILEKLDENNTDKVILVPGELNSKKTYALPDLARRFPKRNVVKLFNALTKMVIRSTGAVKHIQEGNDYVFELAKKIPQRVIQFFWVTKEISGIHQVLEEKHKTQKFKGLKLHQCWESFSVESNYFMNIADWAENKGLPVFIHFGSDKEILKLIEYKKIHQDLVLIIGHLYGLEFFLKEKLTFNNIYFDISTFQVTSDERVMKAIKRFGAEKITFGSDTPYGKNNLKNNIERINRLPISQGEKELILGLNMKNLLGL
ncbi:MAG: amidohydrolase family protein [Candidatus Aminicenantes bacterium]|nr:MAG: amidohydrolase family protein [Candidatus Aminicenantes bacterium]